MIKALFFDLDGTLLKNDKSIDFSTIYALKKCKEKGIQLYVATARPCDLHQMLGWTHEIYDMFDGGVFCNGACIKMKDEVEYTYIDPTAVHLCIEELKKYPDFHLALQMQDEACAMSFPLEEFALKSWGLEGKTILPITSNCELITAKILIYDQNLIDAEKEIPNPLYQSLIIKLHEYCNIYLTDHNRILQIMNKNTSKLNGIKKIQKKCLFNDDEVAVFGDDINDVEMLAGYKNSIAMGNADSSIKSVATYVTYSNEEHGISYCLKSILKLIDE